MTDDSKPTAGDFAPDWARRAIWYQIFPERFRNGDSSNDPTPESVKGSQHGDHTEGREVHPWTSDWYELQPYERRVSDDLWYHLYRRRYGSDLQGILDKLDYLQELGINALYLNPVFEAPSAHKYDGRRTTMSTPTSAPTGPAIAASWPRRHRTIRRRGCGPVPTGCCSR